MSSNFKMTPGREPMTKTGRGIPSSLCSPAQQRKDAVTGEKVPKGAKFGKTTETIDEYGNTVYTTPYSKEGTPGGKFMGKDYVPSEKERIAANKRKAELGIKGTVRHKRVNLKPAGIKPPEAKIEGEIIQPPKRTLTPPSSTNSTTRTTITGKIKKGASKLFNNIGDISVLPTKKSTFKGGCLTD